MTSKSPPTHASQSTELAGKLDTPAPKKMISAHAFDDFIDEKLKQARSSDDEPNDSIVCHVY